MQRLEFHYFLYTKQIFKLVSSSKISPGYTCTRTRQVQCQSIAGTTTRLCVPSVKSRSCFLIHNYVIWYGTCMTYWVSDKLSGFRVSFLQSLTRDNEMILTLTLTWFRWLFPFFPFVHKQASDTIDKRTFESNQISINITYFKFQKFEMATIYSFIILDNIFNNIIWFKSNHEHKSQFHYGDMLILKWPLFLHFWSCVKPYLH